ncbi:hypothetical protein B0H66DRAFT_642846 [Apodospora peruviana]|uniref:Brevianamide F synthase n=1 Tax=Apodospora peruviana TaxID=516989 RepID=A0AAE0HZ83_9PEZI|nr:hypothetical protein B0H66DRAFT_642846 [Apodospora peruviana]
MSLVQDVWALFGLERRSSSRRNKLQPKPVQDSTVGAVTRKIPVPALKSAHGNGGGSSRIDDTLQSSLILAWGLLLQREKIPDDDRVDLITWGRRTTTNGPETTTPLRLSAFDIEFSHARTEPVSVYRDAITKPTDDGSRPCKTVFFVDGTTSLASHKQQVAHDEKSTQWTFQLEVTRKRGILTLQALYDITNETLTQTQITHRLETFISLLQLISTQPTTPIALLLGPLERDLDQIWSWNTALPPTIDRCMHEIISSQASKTPSKNAVESWDGKFTYSEADSLSTRLAHILRARGITLGTTVPLCFEKSRWTIVAVLAVMKAGAAFALTDPTSQPEGRLRAMIEQTGARLVIASRSQTDLARRVVPPANGLVITLSDDFLSESQTDTSSEDLPSVPACTPLYIQFTSGSTGKPKGVVISHANYTSGALPRAAAVGYTCTSRVFEFASYAFDVSIDCMLCTLAVGGTICIPSDADRMNDLGGAILSSGANMAHMTPSVARVLDPAVIAGLDVLGLGGEAVSAADAAAWGRGKTSVIIAYGPSECTVGCTVNNRFSPQNNRDGKARFTTGNIGTGVGGVGWIVDSDDHERLTPVGGVGELIIEGPVVGLGYLGEPGKTAEVFVDAPAWLAAGHGTVPGRTGKLYKTGDLVRYDNDGSGAFVFVGRKDAQVKLRGQRVELVEIEHHLRGKLPAGVKIAAEVIKPSGGEPTLVAFLAEPGAGGESFSTELSQVLAGVNNLLGVALPRYMIPAAYIPLAEMPSLVSGKIDRKKLRETGAAMTREQISGSNKKKSGGGAAPETEMEKALQRVWKTLLGDHIEITAQDSFFAIGGDSLKAMKMVAAARSEGISLTVADVFRYPVLRNIATVASKISSSEQESGGDSSTIEPFSLLETDWTEDEARAEASAFCGVDAADIEDVYPCTPLQEALMALSAKVKDAYVAQRVLKLETGQEMEKLQAAFEAIHTDCAILRTRIIQVSQHGLMQVVTKEPITWRSASSLAEYLEMDRNEDMDLGKPLVRYGLVREGEGAHFVLTMHHALYDGWSMPLVVDRVNKAYQGLPLERPAAEFKHFIHYLNHTLDRAACDTYWRDQLEGATGVQFPTLPFEGYQTRADSLLELEVSLDGRRPPISQNATITLATVVRAAWALVASQYCAGNTDVVFGETLTGRNAPIVGAGEIEGPMITTVPVRVSIDSEVTVEQYLQTIADQVLTQIPYEHAGLQHIRRLSGDALQACELRTGLVLHPAAGEVAADENTPANGLVPAGDTEAAQEALKFNTYALMLVCSLSADGFIVMASFDSNTVDKETMQRALEQLQLVVRQLCDEGAKDMKIGELQRLTQADKEELQVLSRQVKSPSQDSDDFELKEGDTKGLWIVDPADTQRLVPRGAVGELFVGTSKKMGGSAKLITERPLWLKDTTDKGKQTRLYRTGRLAKFKFDKSTPTLCILRASEVKPEAAKKRQQHKTTAASLAVAATSAKQKTLRSIWARLLKLDENTIFLADNFFDRGGDSITAMKLVSEARQQGLRISVAQVFANRTLFDMANVIQAVPGTSSTAPETSRTEEYKPFSLLPAAKTEGDQNSGRELDVAGDSLIDRIRDSLSDKSWTIMDIIPTRPLQEVAVRGTVDLPRFSIRYEHLHFNGMVDKDRLFSACQELVARNEILRTVFVRDNGTCYGVVLDNVALPITQYRIEPDQNTKAFANQLCTLDSQTRMPYGSLFVKFLFVTNTSSQCTLSFRISHAQYDEICLPILLHQLHQLYLDPPSTSIPPSFPFSSFVAHTLRNSIPKAIPYWRNLLANSSGITPFQPSTPITSRRHFAIQKEIDISARSRDVTVATLPSAAWAFTLARHLSISDVLFGEVASGRGVDIPSVPDANSIAGPCWQYVPTRVNFASLKTGHDLLSVIQNQHMATSSHDCMGLEEIVAQCTDWDSEKTKWFDTVVHQDVKHVEQLGFGGGEKGVEASFETLYPFEEPLREWKIQAFRDDKGERMVLEVITFESWRDEAKKLLDEICKSMQQLVERPWEELDIVDQGKRVVKISEEEEVKVVEKHGFFKRLSNFSFKLK